MSLCTSPMCETPLFHSFTPSLLHLTPLQPPCPSASYTIPPPTPPPSSSSLLAPLVASLLQQLAPPPPPSHRHFNRSIPKIFPLIQLAFPLRINHINSTSIELFSLRAFSLSHFPPFPCAPIFRFIFGQLPDPCAPRPLPCPVLLSRPRPVPSLPFDDLPTPLLFCFHFYFLSFSPVSLPSL